MSALHRTELGACWDGECVGGLSLVERRANANARADLVIRPYTLYQSLVLSNDAWRAAYRPLLETELDEILLQYRRERTNWAFFLALSYALRAPTGKTALDFSWEKKMKLFLISFLVNLMLIGAGRSDTLVDYLNTKYSPITPISMEKQREKAISSALKSLDGSQADDMYVSVGLHGIERLIQHSLNEMDGIVDIRLMGDRQLLEVTVSFDKVFSGGLPGLNEILKSRVKGEITFVAGITSGSPNTIDSNTLSLRILAAFRSISVTTITPAGIFDIQSTGDALEKTINDFADAISGVISAHPAMVIKIPENLFEGIDAAPTNPSLPPGFDITVSGLGKGLPIKLSRITWFIDDTHLMALLRLTPGDEVSKSSGSTARVNDYENLRVKFFDRLDAAFGVSDPPDGLSVGLRKSLIAAAGNELFKQASLCAKAQGEFLKRTFAKQSFDETLDFPDPDKIDCTPTKDCTPRKECSGRHIECAQTNECRQTMECRQTEECNKCLVRKPFGGCLVRGNDPFCEVAKVARKASCEAEKAAKKGACEAAKANAKLTCEANKEKWKTACEVEKAVEKAACEIEKSANKLACEAGKETIRQLAKAGSIARLSGGYQIVDGALSGCWKGLKFSPDLSNVTSTLQLSGQANIDLSLELTPLGAVGYLVCQVPWSEHQSFHVTVPASSSALTTSVSLLEVDDGQQYGFTIGGLKIPLRFEPSPAKFLSTSVNMKLSCAGLRLISPLIVAVEPLSKELRGEFSYEPESLHATTDIKLPEFDLRGASVLTSIKETHKALLVLGEMSFKQE